MKETEKREKNKMKGKEQSVCSYFSIASSWVFDYETVFMCETDPRVSTNCGNGEFLNFVANGMSNRLIRYNQAFWSIQHKQNKRLKTD